MKLWRNRESSSQPWQHTTSAAYPYQVANQFETPRDRIKRLLLQSAAFGAGFAVILCLALGGFFWYSNRPEPPKAWDVNALVAAGPPGFNVTDDGKHIQFKFQLENKTDTDYSVESGDHLKVTVKLKNGAFAPPYPSLAKLVDMPIFVPAKQRALVLVKLPASDIPTRAATETDAQYHERIRTYCEGHFENLQEFVIFDDLNHYQINLPRWRITSKEP